MAARSSYALAPQSRRSRPPVAQLRLQPTPHEGSMALALALAGIREMHELDLVAVYDARGQVIACAGDGRAAADLSPAAAKAVRMGPERCAELFPRYGVILDTIYPTTTSGPGRARALDEDVWVVAATTTAYERDVAAIVADVEEALAEERERFDDLEGQRAPMSGFALHLDDDEFAAVG